MPSTFPSSHRLAGRGAFKTILDARVRDHRGAIVISTKPNGLPHNRLGISIGRPVGNAVVRNRIKRLLRESFRLSQHDVPPGYDVVVIVRPHKPLELDGYQKMLAGAISKLHRQWIEQK